MVKRGLVQVLIIFGVLGLSGRCLAADPQTEQSAAKNGMSKSARAAIGAGVVVAGAAVASIAYAVTAYAPKAPALSTLTTDAARLLSDLIKGVDPLLKTLDEYSKAKNKPQKEQLAASIHAAASGVEYDSELVKRAKKLWSAYQFNTGSFSEKGIAHSFKMVQNRLFLIKSFIRFGEDCAELKSGDNKKWFSYVKKMHSYLTGRYNKIIKKFPAIRKSLNG